MAIRELTCTSCPLGCPLRVETDESGKVLSVTGNTCKRGEEYGKKEVTSPVRMVTSTVRVKGGAAPVVPVRTREAIAKDKIFDCMAEIRKAEVAAPVKLGDVVIQNAAGTGVDLIATRTVEERKDA